MSRTSVASFDLLAFFFFKPKSPYRMRLVFYTHYRIIKYYMVYDYWGATVIGNDNSLLATLKRATKYIT